MDPDDGVAASSSICSHKFLQLCAQLQFQGPSSIQIILNEFVSYCLYHSSYDYE